MNTIAIDLDYTLVSFRVPFWEIVPEVNFFSPIENQSCYPFLKNLFNSCDYCTDLVILPFAREFIKIFKALGFSVNIVTARDPIVKNETVDFIYDNFRIHPEDIYFTGLGGSKLETLLKIEADIFIDDRLSELIPAYNKDILCFNMVDTPWSDRAFLINEYKNLYEVTNELNKLIYKFGKISKG